jgi:hypothetical protein
VRIRTGPVVLPLILVLVAATVAACASGGAQPSGPPSPPSPAEQHGMHTAAPALAAGGSPAQLRAQFQQLCAQHTLLAIRVMRDAVTSAGADETAAAGLQRNTDQLGELVTSAFGAAQGDRFRQLWQRRVTHLLAYAEAVADHDATAKQRARTGLAADDDAYASWLAQVRRSGSGRGNMVRVQNAQLMRQLDAYATRDYSQAYRMGREAYEHMFTAGATMAKASMAPKAAASLDTPPQQLRSAFAMLLGEHMALVVDAQRATFAGSREFKAAADQVNANTTAMTKGLAGIVGPKKAAEFQAGWAEHVEGLMAYTAAVADKDEVAKAAAAKQRLDHVVVQLAVYLSGILRDKSAFVPLTGAITKHDQQLMDQVDAYAAGRYDQAQQLQLQGDAHIFEIADTLVDGIQRVVHGQLPVGGSQTGGGGTAHRPR